MEKRKAELMADSMEYFEVAMMVLTLVEMWVSRLVALMVDSMGTEPAGSKVAKMAAW